MRHTLEEEANQRGRRSSGHRPVLKDYLGDFRIDMSRRKEKEFLPGW